MRTSPQSRSASARACAAAFTLAAACLGGCTPADYGAIDMDASKAAAAEKGIGPQARPAGTKKVQPGTMPASPAPPPPR